MKSGKITILKLTLKPLRKHGPAHIVIASRIHQGQKRSDMGESSVQIGDVPCYPNLNPWLAVLGVACRMEVAILDYKKKPYRFLKREKMVSPEVECSWKTLDFLD